MVLDLVLAVVVGLPCPRGWGSTVFVFKPTAGSSPSISSSGRPTLPSWLGQHSVCLNLQLVVALALAVVVGLPCPRG